MDQLDIIERRRRNLRVILFAVILGTLPLYCLGILLWGTAPQGDVTPQPTSIASLTPIIIGSPSVTPLATNTQVTLPTFILPNTPTQFVPATFFPTFIFPTLTPTPFIFPTLTSAPTLTPFPTLTPLPTLTNTLIPLPTATPTPTNTLFPTDTETPTATMTETATETATDTIIPP
jgi:hypothetical protein